MSIFDDSLGRDELMRMWEAIMHDTQEAESRHRGNQYTDWLKHGNWGDGYRFNVERFRVEYRQDAACYRVTDLQTKIWMDVALSAVVEEDRLSPIRKLADMTDDQLSYNIKRRAGKIANRIIRHKEKESGRETKIISVTYGPADREPDFRSPEEGQGGQDQAVNLHLLRTSAGVT